MLTAFFIACDFFYIIMHRLKCELMIQPIFLFCSTFFLSFFSSSRFSFSVRIYCLIKWYFIPLTCCRLFCRYNVNARVKIYYHFFCFCFNLYTRFFYPRIHEFCCKFFFCWFTFTISIPLTFSFTRFDLH